MKFNIDNIDELHDFILELEMLEGKPIESVSVCLFPDADGPYKTEGRAVRASKVWELRINAALALITLLKIDLANEIGI